MSTEKLYCMPAHIYKRMKPNNQAFIFSNILNHPTVTDIHTHNSSSNTSRYSSTPCHTNNYDIQGVIDIVTINKDFMKQKSLLFFQVGSIIPLSIINNKKIKSADRSPHHG